MKLMFAAILAILTPLAFAVSIPLGQPTTGTPVYVQDKTRIQYFGYNRTQVDHDGGFKICPPEIATPNYERNSCQLDGNKSNSFNGWIPLSEYKIGGYTLTYVQVNETSMGQTLVLFWYPTAEVLKADKIKHN